MEKAEVEKRIREILQFLGVSFEELQDFTSDENIAFNIKTKDSGRLIGTRGETLSALNHLVKKMSGKENEPLYVSVDVNGYLEGLKQQLKNKVFILAERARSFKTDVELPPMSSYERMTIHSFLADDPHLETVSVGQGRDRHIVIKYKN